MKPTAEDPVFEIDDKKPFVSGSQLSDGKEITEMQEVRRT